MLAKALQRSTVACAKTHLCPNPRDRRIVAKVIMVLPTSQRQNHTLFPVALPYREECVDISVICDLLVALRAAGVDGRSYQTPSGSAFAPVDVRVLYAGGK